MVKIGAKLSRKSSKDPSWLAMCNVYFRNKLPNGLPVRLMPFSIRVTSCQYELAVIFTSHLGIDTAMSNRHVVSFCEYSDNRYFQQSITALTRAYLSIKSAHNFRNSLVIFTWLKWHIFFINVVQLINLIEFEWSGTLMITENIELPCI